MSSTPHQVRRESIRAHEINRSINLIDNYSFETKPTERSFLKLKNLKPVFLNQNNRNIRQSVPNFK